MRTSTANVAGVEIPVFNGIDTVVGEVDLWSTPAWLDDAIAAVTSLLALQCERKVLEEQRSRITKELVTTSQRVNLFEKVKIPECCENIRVILLHGGKAHEVTHVGFAHDNGLPTTITTCATKENVWIVD
ncbi:MAG: hypothetical protein LIR46_03935 [Bacteroidota bacterium]|nr:hypothetical protein [Bacteroidota bacterium]